jgi:hypothetical protein
VISQITIQLSLVVHTLNLSLFFLREETVGVSPYCFNKLYKIKKKEARKPYKRGKTEEWQDL